MPLNVSREEVLTSYEQEVKKLRRLGKEWRLKERDIDEIINKSFKFLQEQCETQNVKSLITDGTKSRPLYSFKLTLKFIMFVILMFFGACLFITYHRPTYNLVVRNVQELIYPTMKSLRKITLPIVRAFPSITVWYDEMCLVENPYFRAPDINCWACEEVRSVLDLTEIHNPRDFQPYTGFPYIVKGAVTAINYKNLEKLYIDHKQMIDQDAYRIISTISSWKTIGNLMDHELEKNPTTNQDAHIVWRINRLEPARVLRKLFPRPSFIPDTVNMERFILVDEPKAPQYKLPFPEGYRVFVMQASGERLLILEPVEGCNINCTRVSVLLKPSDFLYYNSWFYRPKSNPVENSTAISISYIGSL
ncbi:hypothetical protein L9F63_022060 [Diploptera punctata]|uniref:Uncharacterized protein n=1 Tax=Diploptera punctata TaxID=6984 RepID=A0AAD8EBE4_DIPPU|nr:hypothetical protein L9F63_022060 [Diploptera punctata]